MRRFGPAVRDRILYQTWRYSRTWSDNVGDTFLMDNKVAHCKEISEKKIEVKDLFVNVFKEERVDLFSPSSFSLIEMYDVKSSMHFSVCHAHYGIFLFLLQPAFGMWSMNVVKGRKFCSRGKNFSVTLIMKMENQIRHEF